VWSRGSGSLHHRGRRTGFAGSTRADGFGRSEMTQGTTRAGTVIPCLRFATSASCSGIIALNGVSFDMKQGQILGLIGPNGPARPRCSIASPGSISRAAAIS